MPLLGVSTAELEDLWQRQRRRAQELFDRQPPRVREVQVEEQQLGSVSMGVHSQRQISF